MSKLIFVILSNSRTDLLPIGVFDGGIIFLNENPLNELDCESRLPDATRPEHHKFVFTHLADRRTSQRKAIESSNTCWMRRA